VLTDDPAISATSAAETGGMRRAHRSRRAVGRAWVGPAVGVAVAVGVSTGLFAWMLWRSWAGVNTAGLQMPAMQLQQRVWYWWRFLAGESLGIAALLYSYLAVLAGLLYSGRPPRWMRLSRPRVNALHRHLSLSTIGLILAHVLFVAVGGMTSAMTARSINFLTAFVPFTVTWNTWGYASGIFALYLALILGPTYYLRHHLGVRSWRITHRATLSVYALGVWHTLYFDDFDFHGPYRLALWAAQIPLAGLLLWRLLAARRGAYRNNADQNRIPRLLEHPTRPRALVRLAAATVVAALLAGLILITATGNIGGRPAPAVSASSTHPPT
jgi:hypothetical protein